MQDKITYRIIRTRAQTNEKINPKLTIKKKRNSRELMNPPRMVNNSIV